MMPVPPVQVRHERTCVDQHPSRGRYPFSFRVEVSGLALTEPHRSCARSCRDGCRPLRCRSIRSLTIAACDRPAARARARSVWICRLSSFSVTVSIETRVIPIWHEINTRSCYVPDRAEGVGERAGHRRRGATPESLRGHHRQEAGLRKLGRERDSAVYTPARIP